jgi:hypothetical protein
MTTALACPKVLFILGNNNHNTMLHKVARELSECDAWFTPYYCDEWTTLDVLRRLHLIEMVPLGHGCRARCLAYCALNDLRVDLGGKRHAYDLVVTCSDLIVPENVVNRRLVAIQEGMIDPLRIMYRLRQRLPWLPRWAAGTAGTGLSCLYDRYCVASDGYVEEFAARGAPRHRLVATGLPNFDDFGAHRQPGHWLEDHVLACSSDGRECLRGDDRSAFIRWCLQIADGRPLAFKLHPNERADRAVREISRMAPAAKIIRSGSGEELAANCHTLVTEWSTLAFVGVALGKATYSYRSTGELRRLLPLQHGRGAHNAANVCREALGLGPKSALRLVPDSVAAS